MLPAFTGGASAFVFFFFCPLQANDKTVTPKTTINRLIISVMFLKIGAAESQVRHPRLYLGTTHEKIPY
jgi:hypothetical protein